MDDFGRGQPWGGTYKANKISGEVGAGGSTASSINGQAEINVMMVSADKEEDESQEDKQ